MATAETPQVAAEPVYCDEEGALPRPWVAYRKLDPPELGALYYHNQSSRETKWERPEVRIASQSIYLTPSTARESPFAAWRDLRPQELATTGTAEAAELFRDFCMRLFPYGVFGRHEDGILWRLGDTERVGLVLYPAKRHLAVAYDPQAVAQADLESLGLAAAMAAGGPARLSMAARIAALEGVQRCLSDPGRRSATATAVAPEAHLFRRYAGEVVASMPRLAAAAIPEGAESTRAGQLARHLQGFGLLPPFSCRLTDVSNLRNIWELASHLASEWHRAWRLRLQRSIELLEEIRRGEVLLSEWLPAHTDSYRDLLQWSDRRFQNFPAADGRVFRFDHLSGLGAMIPASSWLAREQAPPPLAQGARPLNGQGSCHLWSAEPPRLLPVVAAGVAHLAVAVQYSLTFGDDGLAEVAPAGLDDEPVLEPHWSAERDERGRRYYYNSRTQESTWERPSSVAVGESWATSPSTRARDTPLEVYQRYHSLGPRPERVAP